MVSVPSFLNTKIIPFCCMFGLEQRFSLLELTKEVQTFLKWNECQQASAFNKIKVLSTKLEKAKSVQADINDLSKKSAFLSQEQISQEKEVIKNRLQEPTKIHEAIGKLKEDPNYLTEEQIENLKVYLFS